MLMGLNTGVNSAEENNSFYYEIPKFRNLISKYGL
jgi:hypothetical protein